MQVRKQVRTGHGTTAWLQIGKGEHQGCVLSPCLLNFYAEYIMQNTGLDESQAGIKIARRNINNLRYGYSEGPMLQSTGLQRMRHDLKTEHLHHPRMLVRAKYKNGYNEY